MWTGFERRVQHGGTIQVPEQWAGRVVLIMTDDDKPVCGSGREPHIPSHEGPWCHVCHWPEGRGGDWNPRRFAIEGGAP